MIFVGCDLAGLTRYGCQRLYELILPGPAVLLLRAEEREFVLSLIEVM